MSDEKIVSWDDLEGMDDVFTKTILCPKLTERLGQDVFVKVRAIEREEFLGAINFPMDEINQMIADDVDSQVFADAVKEQAGALGMTGLIAAMESIIKIGLVEPDPGDGKMARLSADYETIFQGIVDLTLPRKAVAEAAQFRSDGEQ